MSAAARGGPPRGPPPAERDEWQLVRLAGTVAKVERLGDRWRAEIALAMGARAPMIGQAGAGIASTAIVAGRTMTSSASSGGPYPTATDRRFAVLPLDGRDLASAPGGGGGVAPAATHGEKNGGASGNWRQGGARPASPAAVEHHLLGYLPRRTCRSRR